MGKKIKNTETDIGEDIKTIKKLLVLDLLYKGLTQKQVAQVLGLHDSQISRMVPATAFKTKKTKKS